MKNILIGFLTLTSLPAFASIDCGTSTGVTIKISPLKNGGRGHLIETSTGAPVEAIATNGMDVVSFESKDKTTLNLSYYKRTGLGVGELNGQLVTLKCTRK